MQKVWKDTNFQLGISSKDLLYDLVTTINNVLYSQKLLRVDFKYSQKICEEIQMLISSI